MVQIVIVSLAAVLAVAAASHVAPHPQHTGAFVSARSDAGAQVYAFDATNKGDGSYSFSYESPEGTSFQETGAPRAHGPEGAAVAADGSFSYRAPDGQQVALSYTADENGFRPQGSHLPTPPPIPEAILRSLEQIAQHPETNEGTYHHDNSGDYKHYQS